MIVAYYILHYGSDYLNWSIQSIYQHVDKILLVYTDVPSHGTTQTIQNPDTRDAVHAAAFATSDPENKLIWEEGRFGSEGQHRDYAMRRARDLGATKIIVTDFDEIWTAEAIKEVIGKLNTEKVRHQMIRMTTLWRSFNHVCHDNMWPCRGMNLDIAEGHGYSHATVFHFGYARTVKEIEYKLSIHGHRHELKPNWLETFKNWPNVENKNLHPTCNFWDAQPFDKEKLPEIMRSHPYWDVSLIS